MIRSLLVICCSLLLLSHLNGCNALLEDGEGILTNKRLHCINLHHKINETVSRTKIIPPSNFSGQWVSTDCETRDGPQYLLRSYTFDSSSNTMYLLQMYYSDDSCATSSFSIIANGTYSMVKSTTLSNVGTVRLNYDFGRVTVIAHDEQTANDLANKLNAVCPEVVLKGWKHNREYDIFNRAKRRTSSIEQNTVKRDNNANNLRPTIENNNEKTTMESATSSNQYQQCLSAIDVNFDELKSVRMQIKPHDFKDPTSKERKELLFRRVHEGKEFPFQPPLVLPLENPECYICQSVATSIASHVPILNVKNALHFFLNGEWISTGCEIMLPTDYFGMKHLRINSNDRLWQMEHRVYSNNNCSHQLMVYSLSGNFKTGAPSSKSRAFDLDFAIQKAELMIKDSSILDIIRDDKLCHISGYWKVGSVRELPLKQGCPSLGIRTPSEQYALAKVDMEHDGSYILHLGERTEMSIPDFSSSEVIKYRPTSYQYNFIQCSEHPLHSGGTHYDGGNHHGGAGHGTHHGGTHHGGVGSADAGNAAKMQTLPNLALNIFLFIFIRYYYHSAIIL